MVYIILPRSTVTRPLMSKFHTGFQFDYVFDWTISKRQQFQISGIPSRTMGGAGEQTSGAVDDRGSAGQAFQDTQQSTEADAALCRLSGCVTGSGDMLEIIKARRGVPNMTNLPRI